LPHLCLAALLGAAAMLLLGVTTHSRRHQQGLREVEGAGRSEHLAGSQHGHAADHVYNQAVRALRCGLSTPHGDDRPRRRQCVDVQAVPGRGVSAEHSSGYAWCVSSGDGGDIPTLTNSHCLVS
jgi:hypothetical protein